MEPLENHDKAVRRSQDRLGSCHVAVVMGALRRGACSRDGCRHFFPRAGCSERDQVSPRRQCSPLRQQGLLVMPSLPAAWSGPPSSEPAYKVPPSLSAVHLHAGWSLCEPKRAIRILFAPVLRSQGGGTQAASPGRGSRRRPHDEDALRIAVSQYRPFSSHLVLLSCAPPQ